MVFGRHINRYYLRFSWVLLLGLGALVAVDYLQLEIPEFYQIQQLLQCEKDYEAQYRLNATLGLGLICISRCLRGGEQTRDMNIPFSPKRRMMRM